MTIDKYTKVNLTLIAVGVIGINFHLKEIPNDYVNESHPKD